jgi:hypothetical protein
MTEMFEIENQGDHQFVVRLHGRAEDAESWFNLSPTLLDELGVRHEDEEDVVRRTVAFLLRYQEVVDFPQVVELEDLLSTYGDYAELIRSTRG